MKKNLNHYFNFLGWTLNLIRYRNKKDPFKEFHKDTIEKNFNDPKITVGIEDIEFEKFLKLAEKV